MTDPGIALRYLDRITKARGLEELQRIRDELDRAGLSAFGRQRIEEALVNKTGVLMDEIAKKADKIFPVDRPQELRDLGLPKAEALDRFLASSHHTFFPTNIAVGPAPAQKLCERSTERIYLAVANLSNPAQVVYVASSQRVTVGGAGDPEGGWPVLAGTVQPFDKTVTAELWGVAANAGADVRVLELFR